MKMGSTIINPLLTHYKPPFSPTGLCETLRMTKAEFDRAAETKAWDQSCGYDAASHATHGMMLSGISHMEVSIVMGVPH